MSIFLDEKMRDVEDNTCWDDNVSGKARREKPEQKLIRSPKMDGDLRLHL